jgi:hypothetical protein
MPGDIIITAGDIPEDVYILLEGKAEAIGFDANLV